MVHLVQLFPRCNLNSLLIGWPRVLVFYISSRSPSRLINNWRDIPVSTSNHPSTLIDICSGTVSYRHTISLSIVVGENRANETRESDNHNWCFSPLYTLVPNGVSRLWDFSACILIMAFRTTIANVKISRINRVLVEILSKELSVDYWCTQSSCNFPLQHPLTNYALCLFPFTINFKQWNL